MTFHTISHNSGDAGDVLMTCCMCYVVYFFFFFLLQCLLLLLCIIMDRLKPTNDTHVLNLHVDILYIRFQNPDL